MLAPSSSPAATAVHALAQPLAGGRMLTPSRLQQAMETAHGAPAASGCWSWRDAYDAVEAAFLIHVPTLITGSDSDAARLAALTAALRKLPTQTRRSEEQIRLQQFSTPVPYAFIAARAAAIEPGDAVMEPSAGIGALAAFAKLE
ncbi:MAG: methylase/helicase, partial [Alphaproteobacteria bacterium]|nr:methylase/helicase [Alphaproteobacteria bacterium]